ncbi:hypothetical protein [uncultured Lutibacter sp.]|uniref:hypothetical protein n=1 Tax=uncultured Lutibacter sp. TaxID=437739 RepID=UPI0026142363|nr:hypothetical protein [uncultured Lutibacter sp.]
MLTPKNSIELIGVLESENLVVNLIQQLNKDFELANIDIQFNLELSTEKLFDHLNEVILSLLKYKYDDYLNLVYRIDVSEKELAKVGQEKFEVIVHQLVFLILKREYQKVWLRKNYKA